MTTDWKALCAGLLYALENEGYAHWVHTPDEDELCLRARAALAQSEPEGPTRRQLMMLADDMGMTTVGAVTPAEYALAALARWGRPAPQSADDEVAELVDWLRGGMDSALQCADARSVTNICKAINLLSRLSPPQPIPASERLPGQGDCDAEGMCWWWCSPAERWVRCGIPQPDPTSQVHTHWLPARALPVPTHTSENVYDR